MMARSARRPPRILDFGGARWCRPVPSWRRSRFSLRTDLASSRRAHSMREEQKKNLDRTDERQERRLSTKLFILRHAIPYNRRTNSLLQATYKQTSLSFGGARKRNSSSKEHTDGASSGCGLTWITINITSLRIVRSRAFRGKKSYKAAVSLCCVRKGRPASRSRGGQVYVTTK